MLLLNIGGGWSWIDFNPLQWVSGPTGEDPAVTNVKELSGWGHDPVSAFNSGNIFTRTNADGNTSAFLLAVHADQIAMALAAVEPVTVNGETADIIYQHVTDVGDGHDYWVIAGKAVGDRAAVKGFVVDLYGITHACVCQTQVALGMVKTDPGGGGMPFVTIETWRAGILQAVADSRRLMTAEESGTQFTG